MMRSIKVLIDTNVIIGLEDNEPVDVYFSEFVRICSREGVRLFVDDAVFDDIKRDRDTKRRAVTLSKLEKFEKLSGVPRLEKYKLEEKYGKIKNENDLSDVHLLTALDAQIVDFFVTQDLGLIRRAEQSDLEGSVFQVKEFIDWLKQTYEPKEVLLPYVFERKSYEVDRKHGIFESLKADYEGFDEWFDKCVQEHRDCWVLEIGNQIAGLVVRKKETFEEAGIVSPGTKILKICTFKIHDDFTGEKLGEQLLKQVFWYAQKNHYDVVYLTVFPKYVTLIQLLKGYGFEETKKNVNGELFLERKMIRKLGSFDDLTPIEFHQKYYPLFKDDKLVKKFCVPIQTEYHRRLFPEIAYATELPLFPNEEFGQTFVEQFESERTPGNTIKKVYLCRAQTKQMRPGDVLLFYMSKSEGYSGSQCITTAGIIEKVRVANDLEELINFTAKRSVFSVSQLNDMNVEPDRPMKVINFMLAGHFNTFIPLETLVEKQVFSGHPPQSIVGISAESYNKLKPFLSMEFE